MVLIVRSGQLEVQALMDEKAAPDILEFKDDILKAVSDMVASQVGSCSRAAEIADGGLQLLRRLPSCVSADNTAQSLR
jgi:hypothetical protein